MINQLRGYNSSLDKLPTDVQINILQFLDKKEVLTRIAGLSRRFNILSSHQYLWRHLHLQSMNEVTTTE